MTEHEADSVVAHLVRLFPLRSGMAISNAEVPLWTRLLRPVPRDVGVAAVESYKSETARSRPVLGEFRRVLERVKANATQQRGRVDTSRCDQLRAWLGRPEMSDRGTLDFYHGQVVRRAASLYGEASAAVDREIRGAKADYEAAGFAAEWEQIEHTLQSAAKEAAGRQSQCTR